MAKENDEIVCVPLSKLLVTEKKPYKGELVPPPVFADDWETQGVDCSDVPSVIKPDMDGASLAKVAISLRREAKAWLKSNKNLTDNGAKLFAKNFACAIKAAVNASYNNKDLAEILGKEGFTDTLTIWR
ncbi:MAG: hypothetical protein J6Q22_15185 [Prevotella sp.]|nr:hypothetical protein [Prevotella sp.]